MSKTTVVLVILALFGYASAGIFGGSKVECGSSTSSKSINLANPSQPPRTCNYKINSYSSSVCQLRIDFEDLSLAPPTIPSRDNGLDYTECLTDYLEVGGYKFCGQETDQHIYIPFNRAGGEKSVQIKIVTAVRSGGSHLPAASWNIHVEQLECPKGYPLRSLPMAERASNDGYLIAPTGCLQYFPESSGTVKSFNFADGEGTYPGNLNYAICFGRDIDTEGIELEFEDFQLGFNSGLYEGIGESCKPLSDSLGLSEDRLSIADGEVEDEDINANLFCGSSLAGRTVISKAPGPIVVIFHSDDLYNPEIPERGFSFNYNLF